MKPRKNTFLGRMPPKQAVGFVLLMGFALFVSLKIFKSPTETVAQQMSPDGEREARLVRVYYRGDPGYKVQLRTGFLWGTLCYLAEVDAAPLDERVEALHWGPYGETVWFTIDERIIWGHDFSNQSSKLKSP